MKIPLSSCDISNGKLTKISQALVRVLKPERAMKLSLANETVAKMLGYESFHDAQKSAEDVDGGNFKGYRNLLFCSYPMPPLEDILQEMTGSLDHLASNDLTSKCIVNKLPIRALDFFKRASMKIEVSDAYLMKLEKCYFEFAYSTQNLPIEDLIQDEFRELDNFRDHIFLLLKDSSNEECSYVLNRMTIEEILEIEATLKNENGEISTGTIYDVMFLPAHHSCVSQAIGFNPPSGLDDSMDVPSEFYNQISEYLEYRWMEENRHLKGRTLFLKKTGKYKTFEQWAYRGFLDKNGNYKRTKATNLFIGETYQTPNYGQGEALNWDYCFDGKVGRSFVPKVFITGNILIADDYDYSELLESITRDEDGVNSSILCDHLGGDRGSDPVRMEKLCKKIFRKDYLVTISNLEETNYSNHGDVGLAISQALDEIKSRFGGNLHLVVYAAPPEYLEWVPHNDLYPTLKEKEKSIKARKAYLKLNIPSGIAKSITLIEPETADRTSDDFEW